MTKQRDGSTLQMRSEIAEYEAAKAEINAADPLKSFRNSHKRFDNMASSILATSTAVLCCGKGCWYCCHFKIDLRPYEILLISEYVKSKLPEFQASLILRQAEENASHMSTLTEREQLSANLKCPFLVNEACAIYEVRPSMCRKFHSIDVQRCKRSYEEPHNLGIRNAFIEELFFAGKGHYEGFIRAAEEAGYDGVVYELNSAIFEAMTNSASIKRFRKKKRTFLDAIQLEG